MDKQALRAFHQLATCNRETLREAGTGVCTNCAKHVDFDSITQWIDDSSIRGDATDEHTAICPHCGADALIPDVSARLIAALHSSWF